MNGTYSIKIYFICYLVLMFFFKRLNRKLKIKEIIYCNIKRLTEGGQ